MKESLRLQAKLQEALLLVLLSRNKRTTQETTFVLTPTAPEVQQQRVAATFAPVKVAVEPLHGLIMRGALAGSKVERVAPRPAVDAAPAF